MKAFKDLSGMSGRDLWVCSDVHGCLWHLQQAMSIVNTFNGYLLILGDVVDRGPYSLECLELIMQSSLADMCLGNHEINWLYGMPNTFLQAEHREYLLQRPAVFKYQNIYMSHTFIAPSVLEEIEAGIIEAEAYYIYETDWEWVHQWMWEYILISGHIPSRQHAAYGQKKRRPGEILRYGSRIFIDGGTPTTGILPLYNVTQDYEITIFGKVYDT